MSDGSWRSSLPARFAWPGLVLLLAGCAQPQTPPPALHPAPAAAPSALSAPAASGQPADAPADNSYCYVCHINFQSESLTQAHAKAGVGCEQCHGLSDAHSADEDGLTAPDRMFPADRIHGFCMECHPARDLEPVADHASVLGDKSAPRPSCTSCHGEHRLSVRTRRWNKETGELIWRPGGPDMDRPAHSAPAPAGQEG